MVSATVRDIAIIIIAIESIILNVLLVLLVWQVWRMVKMLQTEVKPILRDTQETVDTVRGTATFMSDNLISPVIQANRRAAKWSTTARSLTADLRTAAGGLARKPKSGG